MSTKRAKNSDDPKVVAKYYLTNAKLLPAVVRAKAEGKVTEELAGMLMLLTRKYAQRPCFSGYTYKDDMISEALANLCQNALKFNLEKYDNPFAFYTQCINNSFLQFLNVEKKHRRIRDQLLVDLGENPSYSFSEESKNQANGGEFQTELNELKTSIEEAKARLAQEAIDKAKAEELALKLAQEAEVIPTDIEVELEIISTDMSPSTLLNFE